jgi:hypothetical protein
MSYDTETRIPMITSFDGCRVPAFSYQPCGSRAIFDGDYSYRCENCMAVIGSIGQPQSCKEEANKWKAWEHLGGKGWDYEKGEPKK